jgi:hypothetical protein
MMRRALLAGAALGLSVIVAPVAHADSPDSIHGGCSFDTVVDATGANVGVAYDASVTTDAGGAPIGATVTCWIQVNGIEAPGTRFSYTGVGAQAGANPISFTADSTDTVAQCQEVAYADGSTEPTACTLSTTLVLPPECFLTGCDVLGTIQRFFVSTVDPVVCPVLAQLAGSYPGGVTIDPTGDVSVPDPLDLGLNPVYDCPPYRSV